MSDESCSGEDSVHLFLSGSIEQDIEALVQKERLRDNKVLLWRRRYLMSRIMYSNLQRSGTLANMTVEEYQRRVKGKEHEVVLVAQHKTADRRGSAKVVLEGKLIPILEK